MITRRTVTRGVAWTVPVIAAAVAAPAFAASQPLVCAPTAECKEPGEGSNTKDYAVRTNCSTGGEILGVRVFDDKREAWVEAGYDIATGAWLARGFNDSRRDRLVEVRTAVETKTYTVAFPPC